MIPVVHTVSAAELRGLRTAYHALSQSERMRIGEDVVTIRVTDGCTRVAFDRRGSSVRFLVGQWADSFVPESACGVLQRSVTLPGLDAKAIVVADDLWWRQGSFVFPDHHVLITFGFHVSEMSVPRSSVAAPFYLVSFVVDTGGWRPTARWFFCEGFGNFAVDAATWSVARVSTARCGGPRPSQSR
jgi:hypothetical protein